MNGAKFLSSLRRKSLPIDHLSPNDDDDDDENNRFYFESILSIFFRIY